MNDSCTTQHGLTGSRASTGEKRLRKHGCVDLQTRSTELWMAGLVPRAPKGLEISRVCRGHSSDPLNCMWEGCERQAR
jgi:hypothetical protein